MCPYHIGILVVRDCIYIAWHHPDVTNFRQPELIQDRNVQKERMGDIINIFITRASYGRVRCWLGQPLKRLLGKVSSTKRTLRRVKHALTCHKYTKTFSINISSWRPQETECYELINDLESRTRIVFTETHTRRIINIFIICQILYLEHWVNIIFAFLR